MRFVRNVRHLRNGAVPVLYRDLAEPDNSALAIGGVDDPRDVLPRETGLAGDAGYRDALLAATVEGQRELLPNEPGSRRVIASTSGRDRMPEHRRQRLNSTRIFAPQTVHLWSSNFCFAGRFRSRLF
jgi:hypothetical protein